MANPLVKIAVPLAGVIAATLGRKVAAAGWGVVFGEDAPTPKATKATRKETLRQRKQAKKDGLSKAEIRAIRDPSEEQPIWKAMLWALVSGVLLQGFRLLAQRGAKAGAEGLTRRRPRPNRG
ncbi:DUF4235 domain-containing protein [Brachybacterium sp. J144]|uniref:DUF4235 domain-containing protein n=1 Tax=unclassified Brachybacterium TaxID=2623841 RepID=UPI002E77A149|nr:MULTISPECIES: DUF4235 domain-containing protein [unclassified Brachybacterium]MEE1618947.1 DUF4235 domain-containing protein [Brachybacterium sp. J153]MEE1651720.1 DUF4235 domain-containing protein [Brachybacterium sp. J144]